MGKRSIFLLIGLFAAVLWACGVDGDTEVTESEMVSEAVSEAEKVTIPPNLSQVRSICELATLECYYHNVAKSEKEAGSGIAHWGEKKRTFWIEYTGVAKIGIDMSKVQMAVDGAEVTVTLPLAELQACKVEEISESSFISSEDSWNKNPITAEDQTEAVAKAQEDMEANIRGDSALLVRAQNRAKKLIENYIAQLGMASDMEYHINWVCEEPAD